MTKRIRELLDAARMHKAELDRRAASDGSFAHTLASQSIASHIDDLSQQIALLEDRPILELLEFRLKASRFQDGSVPLRLVAKAADEIRQMLGYAALRLSRGGVDRKRVPEQLYDDLDLRLAAILPGSSRLVITTAAHRDLFDDGLAKNSLDRIFRVLESRGEGEEFLEAVTDLGRSSARRMRYFLHLVRASAAELELSWRYSGQLVRRWDGSDKELTAVTHALDVTELNSREEVVLEGVIELLSKRERIHLLTDTYRTIRVLFPKRLLPRVSELHLDQHVRLRCSVTETSNPFTGESSTFYELLDVVS
jgi:hypothetical protein